MQALVGADGKISAYGEFPTDQPGFTTVEIDERDIDLLREAGSKEITKGRIGVTPPVVVKPILSEVDPIRVAAITTIKAKAVSDPAFAALATLLGIMDTKQ